MYMRHNSAGTERLHGIAKDIPADCLHNVFAKFWPVRFQPLPFFCAADAHVGDSITAELVGADLWLDVAEPSPRWQRNEQHPAGAGKPDAVSRSLTATSLKSIGTNAMAGLKAGINAGRSGVVSAMQSAARAAVNAAKKELKIASPSRVFRDEIGTMTMKGFGEGVLQESRVQARTIRNAARFLTGEAREGAIAFGNNDNRKTYNQTSSVNLSGNNFYVRDEQDIRSLAIEIATLTKRQQRGKGLRMA